MVPTAVEQGGKLYTEFDSGRVGELLTAYHLELAGVQTSLVDRRGPDIWCTLPNGRMVKVEVKTASYPTARRSNEHESMWTYSYQVRRKDSDWYAFVALDISTVIFRHKSFIKPHATQRLKPALFGGEAQANSLQSLLTGIYHG